MIRKLNTDKVSQRRDVQLQISQAESLKLSKGRAAIITICGAAAVGAGWLNESLGWLALLGLAAFLLIHLTQTFSLRCHFLIGWLHGFVSFAIATNWIPYSVGYLLDITAWSLLIGLAVWMYVGLQYALIGMALAALRRRSKLAWLAAPTVWLVVLFLFPNLFPFLPACLLTGFEPLLQLAEVGGVYLVSIYTLAIAGFIAWTICGGLDFYRTGSATSNGFKRRCLACLILFGIFLWGDARMKFFDGQYQAASNEKLTVGLVQAATQYDVSHQKMIDASNAMAPMVDLILWPENSLGNYSTELADFSDADAVFENSRGEGFRFQPWPQQTTPLLAGADTWHPPLDSTNGVNQETKRYVSALLIGADQKLVACRHKIKLMPFGEYIPGESMIPGLYDWLGNGPPITAGEVNNPLAEFKGVRIGTLLCCEDMHPSVAAEQVQAGSNLLVTLGNNVVFNSDTVGQQHFRIARFRAIENRVSMLRCMSTGVSGVVSLSGRVQIRLPESEDTAVVVPIPKLETARTVFNRVGHLIPVTLLSICIGLVFVSGYRAAGSK